MDELEIIKCIKKEFPNYSHVNFHFYDYEVGYSYGSALGVKVDISEVQKFVNKLLGLKSFYIERINVETILATTSEEAKRISNRTEKRLTYIQFVKELL
jgi:ribosomal 50S subunit-associated protein YjgA (DUF615 family)